MKYWILSGLASAILILATPTADAQDPGVLRLPWNQWQVHDGDNPQCAQIDIQSGATACTVKPLNSNSGWTRPNQWQRIEVTLPAELQSTPQLGLLVRGEFPVYEVFVNGQSIGSSGNFATRQGPQYTHAIFSFPSSLARQGRLLIAIHALNVHTVTRIDRFAPALASIDRIETVGDLDTLNYLGSSLLHYLCYVAMFSAGFLFLLLYSVNTRLHEYFWLGARLCTLPLLRLCDLALVADLSMPSWLARALYAIINATQTFIAIEFVFSFLGRPVPKFFRAIQLFGGLYLVYLVLLIPWPAPVYYAIAGVTESSVIQEVAVWAQLLSALGFLLLLPVCFKSKLPEMRWIGAATLFFTVEESTRMLTFIRLPSLPQDLFWHGQDIDLRGLSNLLFAIVMLVAMTFRLRRIQDRNRDIEQEMSAARSIQQILIPDQLPTIPGFTIESAYLPAQEVGGDFFQILPIPNSGDSDQPSAFIILGDVSGKGLKAAMTVSLIVGSLRAFTETYRSPGALLTSLNRLLHGRGGDFATCLVLMITPSGELTLANAAHPSPYLDGEEFPTEPNLPLGISLDITYSEAKLQLSPDQRVTLVTDGVVEATNPSRELFGFDRTQTVSNQSASFVAEAAQSFGMGAPQADDITVLTIARAPVALPRPREILKYRDKKANLNPIAENSPS